MIRGGDRTVLSASDLINYLGCRHSAFLDLHNIGKEPPEPDDGNAGLLAKKGDEHELRCLAAFRTEDKQVAIIDKRGTIDQRLVETRAAMQAGAEVIYQGALSDHGWLGFSDFLTRVPMQTRLGDFGYEVSDAKLSRSAKPKHVVQLCVYARLLERAQGSLPQRVTLLLGDGTKPDFAPADFLYYSDLARERLRAFVTAPPAASAPEPCAHCSVCRWRAKCEAEWETTDHLSLTANITRNQITKLRSAGIDSVRALSLAPGKIPNLQPETLAKLKQQARLQTFRRDTGQNRYEILPTQPGKGFARLPRPNPGDLFFDMEGDPLLDGGLEYLFGFALRDGGSIAYRSFWGHSRAQEKTAFEHAVDFITARLGQFPAAHIYHYAAYEENALKKLSVLHGTRENEIDNLLRNHKLVDLFRVVREGIRVSEPSYSIKNLEHFYLPPREGAIRGGGESVVIYEQWREWQEPKLLRDIENYNRTDCLSTLRLCDWLLTLRPADTEWYDPGREKPGDEAPEQRQEAEQRRQQMADALLRGAPEGERDFRELVSQLLEFHRREAKPQYWAMFHRQEMTDEELLEDAESIGCVEPDRSRRPEPVARSAIRHFTFPAQDYKLREGGTPLIASTRQPAGEIVALDDARRSVSLKISNANAPDYGARFSLIPGHPYDTRIIRAAVYRYAADVVACGHKFRAITSFLKREPPAVTGVTRGAPVISGETTTDAAVKAIAGLRDSCLLVQGPPGAGKTWTASHAIAALLKANKRVGISSNSHKAINKLLEGVVNCATEQKLRFRGVRKISDGDHAFDSEFIENTKSAQAASAAAYQLVAGTAWQFAREDMAPLDCLFIDEAGQVSLANVIASGTSARNLVLIGDQMQLAQPTQGVHPGRSGLSALEYALQDHATMPPPLGIFLGTSWRMHPDVCRFISDAFYESRLHAAADTKNQRLVLATDADPALKPTGLSFLEVAHRDCSQSCPQEAERLGVAYASLLKQSWIDRHGKQHRITKEDILVVSPYNMQVDLLCRTLPDGARIGTVDKFQGQEAAVVLISMATSSHEDLPRNIEFLYSRNRLNVAISRARCFAVIFASPRLLETPCNTIAQMQLVNALCHAWTYAREEK